MPPRICSHCGCEVDEPKRRSGPQHRMFFAAIAAAYSNWPIEHRFLPSNEEHLRAWLLVQAGYHNIVGQNLVEEADIFRVADFTQRLMSSIRAHGSYGFVEVTGRKSLVVKFPKSIAYRELSQQEFHPIAQAVFEIIQAELGILVEDLVREHEAAA